MIAGMVMPNRFIKESCRSSKNLDKLSDLEERLFWRLITTADDYGRFLACPELVRSACFPYKTLSTERVKICLESMQVNDLIRLYSVDDREYGYFMKWEKHQGKPRSKNSKYPEPLASASTCEHLLANVTGGPNTNTNTNTDTNTDKREGSGGRDVKRGKRSISEEDRPTEKHYALGQQLGVDVGPEWGKFKNYCKAHDRRYADFEAAFRNWIAKSAEMKGGQYGMR